ncbi:circularly permuted type 2 ATP-grasp protein [Microlunatus capsulatus]|uniref:Circularly permuted ATP-grasp superfamily protein/putative alpha-E superfamily protein n=1 Tax=Microlunatus capsulatus TaxID=99117 RepID=A0ABS4Z6I1_9ACTN|nr:circularly permuted type 2 ATP-grasp protein [Microlunatus capsulatus]MBP2416322.1 putative circularly permuted ATP-grasp superfamily protein/putative alpha-E superfamily protein [Microlunatus capsulatus]
MTVLGRYLATAGQGDVLTPEPGFDELAAPDGTPRRGWRGLLEGLDRFVDGDLAHAQREVARLLEDDNVTYTPSPGSAVSVVDDPAPVAATALAQPRPWRLDPVPLVLDDREWAVLEAGVVQRAELLDAVLADLYGPQRLLASGDIPAAAVLDHSEYLRPVVGTEALESQRLFLTAADLGRDAAGDWKVLADRTQAPSGAGFAMQNRRVVSRVMPELYHAANLHRLTPFFQAMRTALVESAPPTVEDPRVVVLSPGPHSETAFDQAFVASLLGFPLVEGSDLTVRDGRVWLRGLGRREQVDVILRRVDSVWTDPLELRPGSRLGVSGLLECVRQGSVSVVNTLGSGILENPALLPFLPRLSERLLGQPLRLPSVDTWWCGDPAGRSHVLAHLDELVVRPITRDAGRSVLGSALTAAQRETLRARIDAAPHRFVGQEVLPLSSAPTTVAERLVPRDVVLRSFVVRSGTSYTPMLGGLARVADQAGDRHGPLVTAPDGGLAKDVWVVSSEPVVASRVVVPRRAVPHTRHPSAPAAMVPRVLSDLFWFGRYAERAEDLLRLVLATRTLAIETDLDTTHGRALEVLLQAVTHVSTAYPGFLGRAELMPELRAMLLDRHRSGTAAQALASLSMAAQGVRDQLSEDVWMVLAEVDRALAALAANPHDQGLQLVDVSERVLSGLLALAGIISENMVRDPGWFMLDAGRGIERALQVVALLRVTVVRERAADTDRMVAEAVLTASESIVTYRRRYRGRSGPEALVELLVVDQHNPRSVAYQLARVLADLQALPTTSPTARPLRLLETLVETVRTADPDALVAADGDRRPGLERFLAELHDQLRDLSDAVRTQYQQQPPTQQPLSDTSSWGGTP